MINRDYRIMYNAYKGDGWQLYKQGENLVDIIKSLGVLQVCHPTWRVKIEVRTISEWKEMEIE